MKIMPICWRSYKALLDSIKQKTQHTPKTKNSSEVLRMMKTMSNLEVKGLYKIRYSKSTRVDKSIKMAWSSPVVVQKSTNRKK